MKEKDNQNPTKGYFGKLPVFNDFIRYNAGNNEILVLDEWLQQGIILAKQKLKNDWKFIYENSLALRFFYPFTGTNNFISGIIFPSKDRSNRDFPFLIFFISNKRLLEKTPFYLVPLMFSNKLNTFEEIFNHINNDTTQQNLNENINQILPPVFEETANEQYQTFVNNLTLGNFWERIYSASDNIKKYNIINNIFNSEIQNSTVILKFNFYSDNKSIHLDICFLLNIIASSKNNFFLPAIFWTKDINNNISLYIFPSKPTPINYFDMIYLIENNDRIFNVEEKLKSSQVSQLNVDFLNKNEMKLAELLQILNSLKPY